MKFTMQRRDNKHKKQRVRHKTKIRWQQFGFTDPAEEHSSVSNGNDPASTCDDVEHGTGKSCACLGHQPQARCPSPTTPAEDPAVIAKILAHLALPTCDPIPSLSCHTPRISNLPHSPVAVHSLASRWASASWPRVMDFSKWSLNSSARSSPWPAARVYHLYAWTLSFGKHLGPGKT